MTANYYYMYRYAEYMQSGAWTESSLAHTTWALISDALDLSHLIFSSTPSTPLHAG